MIQPITHSLVVVTKKYLSAFSSMVGELPIERYHHTLVLIEEYGERLSQQGLAELLEIDKSYMVAIIDYLSEKGYVKREKNPHDRREQVIKLTERAKNDLAHIKNATIELNKRTLQNIEASEIAIFNRVLSAMEANLSPLNFPESMHLKKL